MYIEELTVGPGTHRFRLTKEANAGRWIDEIEVAMLHQS